MGLRVFACALGVALTSSAAIAGTEPVEIPYGDLTLHAMLYRPDGPGPFPAVVALHDCGGLKRRPNTEAQLYSIWANKLVADGFVVLFPDSFESRSLGSQCRERHRSVRASRDGPHDGFDSGGITFVRIVRSQQIIHGLVAVQVRVSQTRSHDVYACANGRKLLTA